MALLPTLFPPRVKARWWPGDQKGVTALATTAGFLWLKVTDERNVTCIIHIISFLVLPN